MPFNAKNIHSITYSVDGINGTRRSIGWKEGTAHNYHVWVDAHSDDDFKLTDTLFKNPQAERDQPGHFETRRLDATAKSNAEMINYVIDVCKRNALHTIAKQEYRNKQIAEETARAERAKRIEDAKHLFQRFRDFMSNGHQGTFMIDRADMLALLEYAPTDHTDI